MTTWNSSATPTRRSWPKAKTWSSTNGPRVKWSRERSAEKEGRTRGRPAGVPRRHRRGQRRIADRRFLRFPRAWRLRPDGRDTQAEAEDAGQERARGPSKMSTSRPFSPTRRAALAALVAVSLNLALVGRSRAESPAAE